MREFDYTFSDGFRVGLRPYKTARNVESFTILKNGKVGKFGLEPIDELGEIFPQPRPETYPDISQDWPFPQYFHGSRVDLLGLRKTLYEVNSDGSLTPIVIDIDNVQSDDLWDVGDFNKYQIVMKDKDFILEKAGDTGAWTKTDAPHSTIPMATCVENYSGQALVGDISFDSWSEVDDSYVAWSRIGSASFIHDRSNVPGYMPMDFAGPIYRIKQLGKFVIVYGMNGVGMLYPTSSPAPTYGYNKLVDFGITGKGAVGGDHNIHCFLGRDGMIYKLALSGPTAFRQIPTLKQVGYKDKASILSSTAVVSYVPGGENENEGDFYIGDEDICYLLSSYGMSTTHQKVSAAHRVSGIPVGMFESDEDTDFLGVTDIVDFGYRGQKTAYTFEVGCSGDGTYSVALDWRVNSKAAFQTTQFVELNDQGVATLICAGAEFKIRIKYDNPVDLDISYIKIRYKSSDNRSMRGFYRAPRNEGG